MRVRSDRMAKKARETRGRRPDGRRSASSVTARGQTEADAARPLAAALGRAGSSMAPVRSPSFWRIGVAWLVWPSWRAAESLSSRDWTPRVAGLRPARAHRARRPARSRRPDRAAARAGLPAQLAVADPDRQLSPRRGPRRRRAALVSHRRRTLRRAPAPRPLRRRPRARAQSLAARTW